MIQYFKLFNAIDTPTDTFTGNSAQIEINQGMHLPSLFIGIIIGIGIASVIWLIIVLLRNKKS